MRNKIYLLFFITSLSVNANALCEKDWGNNYTCKTDGRIFFIGEMVEMFGDLAYVDGTYYYKDGHKFTGIFHTNDANKEGLFEYSSGDTYKGTYFDDGIRDEGVYKFAYDDSKVMHDKTVTYKGHDVKVESRTTGIKYKDGEQTHRTKDIIISVTGDHYVNIPTKTIDIKIETIDGEWSYVDGWFDDYKTFVSGRISFTQGAIDREIYTLKSKQPDYTYKIVKSYKQYSNGRKKNTFNKDKGDMLQVQIDKSKNVVRVSKSKTITKWTKYKNLEDEGLFCDTGKITSICEGALSKNEYLKYEFNHALGSLTVTREKNDIKIVAKFKSK
jgi:hypothetical protein